jgi:hypothetical protein
MQSGLLPECSTKLISAGNSGVMIAHCGEINGSMSYTKRNNSAIVTIHPDCVAVRSLTATSVALKLGEDGSPADNLTILTKLILSSATLQSNWPSIVEGLASFMMPSLVMSAQGSSFEMFSVIQTTNFV